MKDPLVGVAWRNVSTLMTGQAFVKLTKEVAEFSGDLLTSAVAEM